MKSPSNLYLGCLIEAKQGEFFAQIVEKRHEGVLGYKVVASAMAKGKDETLAKVCGFAGCKETPPRATYGNGTGVGVVQDGLTFALRRCEKALDGLNGYLGAKRRLEYALDELLGTLTNDKAAIGCYFRNRLDGRGDVEPDRADVRDGREDFAAADEGNYSFWTEEWLQGLQD